MQNEYAGMDLRLPKNVSVTQVSTFRDCPRKWWFGWVARFPRPESPSTSRGLIGHRHNETYGRYLVKANGTVEPPSKVIEDPLHARYVEAALEFMPRPGERAAIETEFYLETGDGLPPWVGKIDVF